MILTIDLGTTATKAALWDEDGLHALARSAVATRYPRPGWAEQDPEEWWGSVCAAVAALAGAALAPDAIVLSGARQSLVPVAADGEPLGPGIVWSDRRATAQAAALAVELGVPDQRRGRTGQGVDAGSRAAELGGGEAQRRRTGQAVDAGSVAAKVRWLAEVEPARLVAARWLLSPRDLVVHRLTGAACTDWTLASATGLYGVDGTVVVELAGPAIGLLPEVLPSTHVVGPLLAEPAAALGVRPGTPVVLGAGDRACEVLGTGAGPPPGRTTQPGVGQGPHAPEEGGLGRPPGRTTQPGVGQGPHAPEEGGLGRPPGRTTQPGVGQGPHAPEEGGLGRPPGRTTQPGVGQGPHAPEEGGLGRPPGPISMASWGTTANVSLPVAEWPDPVAPGLRVSRGALGGWIVEGGVSAAGSLLGWLAGICGTDPETLMEEAAAVPAGARGVTMLPWLGGARAPWWRPDAGAAVLGLMPAHGRGDLARAAVEGVARDVCRCLAAIAGRVTGTEGAVARLALCGGGAAVPPWAEVLAAMSGLPTERRRSGEAASAGAALLASAALGLGYRLDRMDPVVEERASDPAAAEVYRKTAPADDRTAAAVLSLTARPAGTAHGPPRPATQIVTP